MQYTITIICNTIHAELFCSHAVLSSNCAGFPSLRYDKVVEVSFLYNIFVFSNISPKTPYGCDTTMCFCALRKTIILQRFVQGRRRRRRPMHRTPQRRINTRDMRARTRLCAYVCACARGVGIGVGVGVGVRVWVSGCRRRNEIITSTNNINTAADDLRLHGVRPRVHAHARCNAFRVSTMLCKYIILL